MKKHKDTIIFIIIYILIVLTRIFFITQIRVDGDSMNNTLKDGDLMFLKKYEKNSIDRFDIIVFKRDNDKLIKRVIGLPEEDIEYKNNILYINNKQIDTIYGLDNTSDFKDYCSKDEYFVLGDNRENSLDSRVFSCVNKKDILGVTDFRFFPLNKIGKVDK